MKCSVFKVAFPILIFSALTYIYSDTVHEVQAGDTLYSISKKYGVSVSAIQSENGFSDNGIKIGQKIKIPDNPSAASAVSQNSKTASSSGTSTTMPATSSGKDLKNTVNSGGAYTVQKGETWFGISKKYGISVAELQNLNGVSSDAALKVGQKIRVPSSSPHSTAAIASSKKSADVSKSSAAVPVQKVPDLKTNDPHNYSSKKADSSLVWPVKTENIVYINGKVGGVSMAAKKNEEVKAIRAGTVMFSGSYRGFGNVVFIQSKTGHIYAYTGLGSIDVSKGDYINYSSEIGTAGIDTYTGKSQISLMVFQNGQPIDPAKAPRG